MSRRRLLRLGLSGTLAAAVAACGRGGAGPIGTAASRTPVPSASRTSADGSRRVLVAYFSRAGENYSYGNRTWLSVGNTEVVAGIIAGLVPCDLHEIEAAEPYPDRYDACVDRNSREQDEDARPALAGPLPDVGDYDVVLLGSPIWNVRTPMIMSTLTEGLDLTGKSVHPFVTYAVSGLGSAERDYADTCPGATLGEALAVRGEEAADARAALSDWLRRCGLLDV